MDFIKKNNFIVAHAGAQHFDKDFELFKILYPESTLIPELNKVNKYNKKQMDERMLLEILNVVCEDEVQDNRGVATKKAAKKKASAKKKTVKKTTTKKVTSKPDDTQKKSEAQG